MAINCQAFEFVSNTTTGNQTIVSSLPFTPKGYILFLTQTVANATFEDHSTFCIGMCDGTTQCCVGGTSEDAVATSDTGRYHHASAVLSISTFASPGSSTRDALATHSSFGADNIVINWSNAPGSAWRIFGFAFGGADFSCELKQFTYGRTTTGNQSYTTTMATPQCAFFLPTYSGTNPNSEAAHSNPALGVAISTTKRASLAINSESGRTTMDTWRLLDDTKCMTILREDTGATYVAADFVSWNANGVTLNYTTAPTSSSNLFYAFFMKGANFDLGVISKRTSTGTTQVNTSGVGTLKGLLLLSDNTTKSATPQAHARACLGLASSTSKQFCMFTGDTDNAADAICVKYSNNTNVFVSATEAATAASSTTNALAQLTVFGNDTFTINYSVADAGTADIVWWVIGEVTQQDITKNVGDTYSVSDAVARLVSFPRGIADTYNVTDSISRLVNKPRPIGDTYNVTDAVARLVNNTRAIADTYNVTDAVTRALSNTRLIIDTINISDSITRLVSYPRSVADTINISDAVARLVTRTRAIGDTYSVSDSLAKITNHPRNIGDTYNVTDSISVNVVRTRAVGDTYNVTDSITRAQTLVRAIADTFNITDAVTRAATLTRLLIESYSISDAVARALTLLRSVADTYNVTDAITRLVSFQRMIADSYNIVDALTRSQILTRAINDNYDVTDSITRLLTSIKNLSDNYNIEDLVDRTLELTRILEDTYNITDSVNRLETIFRDVADSFNISDNVTRAQELTRAIGDNITINETIDRVLELTREIADTFNITDNVNNAASITIDIGDTYNITDAVARSQQLTRTITDNYNVTDLVTRLVTFARLVEDTYNVNDAVIRQILTTKLLQDTIEISDEVETQIDEPANVINVELEDSYNISDNITKEQILQRIIQESYNVTDSIQKEGGQEPTTVDEHLQIKGGMGLGLGIQESLNKQKRRIIKRVVMDLLPESFPDKIYIDNQKAWFLNDKLDTSQKVREIRFTNKVSISYLENGAKVAPFAIKNGLITVKQVKDREQLKIAIKQMETNDYALKQFIQNTIPRKIKFENLEGIRITNPIIYYSNTNASTISIQNAVTVKHTPINTIINHVLVIPENAKPINIKSPILLNTTYNFNIKNKIEVQNNYNKSENRVTSLVYNNKKYSIKEIKNILLNKSSTAYDKILSNILKKNYSNTDEKEKLYYYLSNYQTRFDIEKTKTNRDMDRLDKKYGDKLEILYAQIAEEYRNDLPNLWKAKDAYGKQIYDDIRNIAQKGYNIGIDYVSRATERDDIYVTQKDLDNVKAATEKSYNHFWESIEKNIKTKQIRLAYEEVKRLQETEEEEVAEETQQNQNVPIILPKDTIKEKPKSYIIKQKEEDLQPQNEILPEQAILLLIKSLTTGIVALATFDKLLQMQDIFNQQNVLIRFIFATERDASVCPSCLQYDYRLTDIQYTQNNFHLLPKPPIHFRCRCRILLKIGNRVIVK